MAILQSTKNGRVSCGIRRIPRWSEACDVLPMFFRSAGIHRRLGYLVAPEKTLISEQPSGNLRHTAIDQFRKFFQTTAQPGDGIPVCFHHFQ